MYSSEVEFRRMARDSDNMPCNYCTLKPITKGGHKLRRVVLKPEYTLMADRYLVDCLPDH